MASELNSDTEREEQISRQVHQASDVAEQPMSEDTAGEREDKMTDAVRLHRQESHQQSSLVEKVDDCAQATKQRACRFYVRFYFASEKMHTTLELMFCWFVQTIVRFHGLYALLQLLAPLWQPVALSSLCYFCCLLLVFRSFRRNFCTVSCNVDICFVKFCHFGHFILRFSVFVVELFGCGLP